MEVVVFSKSIAFKQYINQAIDIPLQHKDKLTIVSYDQKAIVFLIHSKSYSSVAISDFFSHHPDLVERTAILDDFPSVQTMLLYTHKGVKAYCNTYMASAHYHQLVELLSEGQSWYPPGLLEEVFKLAGQHIQPQHSESQFKSLTPRQKQIAYKVAEGNSNKIIARDLDITERTVKSHLSNIFKRLEVKDRMALTLYIKNQTVSKTGT